MTKHIFMTAVMLFIAGFVQADDTTGQNAEQWVTVNSVRELKAALADTKAWVRLGCDISFGKEWLEHGFGTEKNPFSGRIDGQGHTISNYKRLYVTTYEDPDGWNVGLFDWAKGAVFENFALDSVSILATCKAGALVGNSSGCTYRNLTIGTEDPRSILVYGTGYYVGSMIGMSEKDTVRDCTVRMRFISENAYALEPFSPVHADGFSLSSDANVGGFAGGAKGSVFRNCENYRDVYADADRVGGFVGSAERCRFEYCRNHAIVSHEDIAGSDDEIGGIAGFANDCDFISCTNTGACTGGDAYVGGIAGYAKNGSLFRDCLSSGKVSGEEQTGGIAGYADECSIRNCLVTAEVWMLDEDVDEDHRTLVKGWGRLFGEQDDTGWSNNYILNDKYNAGNGGRALVTAAQLASGQVAWWLNESDANITAWRQNLSGENIDAIPVPDSGHAVVAQGAFSNILIINTEDDLHEFARRVYEESDGVTQTAVLAADIVLADPQPGENGTNWLPIGTVTGGDCSKAYRGIFMGNGHTVSNIQISTQSNYVGFFGALSGGAVIMDLTVDGRITGGNDSYAYGGIAGAAESTSAGIVQILRCGNKAEISAGGINVGGIIGAVYTCNDLELEVSDCWNTGEITGLESAALCGSVKKKATFTNCWNGGNLVTLVNTDNYPYVRPGLSGYNPTLTNCYQLEGFELNSQTGKVSTFTSDQMADGTLCCLLNGGKTGGDDLTWQQDLGNDPYPEIGGNGLYHTRTMSPEYEYGTVCVPFALTSDDDFKFYTLSSADNGNMNFSFMQTVPAGTPCLVHRLTSNTELFLMADGSDAYTAPAVMEPVDGFRPTGTYCAVSGKTGCYYISKDQLWYARNAVAIPAFRAWFEASVPHGSAVAIRLDGTTDVIGPSERQTAPTAIFDMYGRRYGPDTQLAPGIYIINGKKQTVR